MKYAAFDFGTNSLRMQVAERAGTGLRPLFSRLDACRLGRGSLTTGRLSPPGKEQARFALRGFLAEAAAVGARPVGGIATEAFRRADDGAEFLAAIAREFGLAVELISGEREAHLTWRGVTAALPPLPDPHAIIDIGGGSTEVIEKRGAAITVASHPFGSVVLTERFLAHDPPAAAELAALQDHVARALPAARGWLALVGVGGTVTALAAIAQALLEYDPARVHGSRLPREHLDRLVRLLAALPVAARDLFPGLGPGRSDIIVAGAAILQVVVAAYDQPELIVSDNGILLGYLYEQVVTGP